MSAAAAEAVDSIPSVLAQGLYADFVRHEPLVRNYNSGLTRKGYHWFLATRHFNRDRWRCDIVINKLSDDGTAEFVKLLPLPRAHGMENFEDARLFWHNGSIYCAFTEGHYWMRPWVAIQKVALLTDDWEVERVFTIPFGHNTTGQEKNWQFFSHYDRDADESRLCFVYSVSPHVVVELNDDFTPAAVHQTDPKLDLPLRGGTPPVRVGNHYVTFPHYHLPHDSRSRRYGFNALRFEAVAPFRVVGVTEPLIVASAEDPTLPNLAYPHWHPIVVFPCGAALERVSWVDAGTWRLSAGINDSFDVIFKIPHERLAFQPVEDLYESSVAR